MKGALLILVGKMLLSPDSSVTINGSFPFFDIQFPFSQITILDNRHFMLSYIIVLCYFYPLYYLIVVRLDYRIEFERSSEAVCDLTILKTYVVECLQ